MSSGVLINKVVINNNREPLYDLPLADPQVRGFHRSLPHFKPTPLVSLPEVAHELGIGYVLLKDESSRLGMPAFKILGASWAAAKAVTKRLGLPAVPEEPLKSLASASKAAGFTLYAATDGNHGHAVARMAKYLGIEAAIYVPNILGQDAKDNIKSEGATVVVIDGDYDQTVLEIKLAAERHPHGKGVLISDTALVLGDETAQWIVDGYQTMFDEIEEQIVDSTGSRMITHVLTPVGVGSLAQAVVTHFERVLRDERPVVLSVEPEAAACLKCSLEAEEMRSVRTDFTICTGMCCGTLSANGWPLLKKGIKAAVVVNDLEVDRAVRELERYDIHAGPCGAATLAGLRRFVKEEALFPLDKTDVVVLLCTEGKRKY